MIETEEEKGFEPDKAKIPDENHIPVQIATDVLNLFNFCKRYVDYWMNHGDVFGRINLAVSAANEGQEIKTSKQDDIILKELLYKLALTYVPNYVVLPTAETTTADEMVELFKISLASWKSVDS